MSKSLPDSSEKATASVDGDSSERWPLAARLFLLATWLIAFTGLCIYRQIWPLVVKELTAQHSALPLITVHAINFGEILRSAAGLPALAGLFIVQSILFARGKPRGLFGLVTLIVILALCAIAVALYLPVLSAMRG